MALGLCWREFRTRVASGKLRAQANVPLPHQHECMDQTMTAISMRINGESQAIDCPADMPLLWVLRDLLALTGTKFGCGIGACGLCTVHLDGTPVRACVLPVAACEGADITTIEGLSADGEHPLQRAWEELNVPQCGYCQPGQIMHAASLLRANSKPTVEEINSHMAGVLCRCGTYPRIRQAIALAAAKMSGEAQ